MSRRCFPHGCYSLFISILCSAAWSASLFQDGCDFAKVEGPIVAELTTAGEIPPPWLTFGIGAYRTPTTTDGGLAWISDYTKECTILDESASFIDTAWFTARTFAFLALVIGGGGTVFLWASAFFVFSRGTWRWTGYLILIGSLCNALTFLWFRSGICDWNTCTMDYGSQADIAASLLWFLGGLLIVCRYPAPKHMLLRNGQIQETEIPTATVMSTEEEGGVHHFAGSDDDEKPVKAELC